MSAGILCVDDEPNVLLGLRRQLRKHYEIDTAASAAEALDLMGKRGAYAVVVSDMRMPGMDGIQLLAAVKSRSPETVRIMLTGNADQQTAIEAVNTGSIFRFLSKPCPPEILIETINAGLEQYRLVTAEKELLEKTLRGSIKMLTEVLALSNPTAFGHASRVRSLVRGLCRVLRVEHAWRVEMAAMLSQVGCVTIPPDTLERLYRGEPVTPEESRMFDAHPAAGQSLVANIPRLEQVAEIVGYQHKGFDGSGMPADAVSGQEIPLGARILKAALDFDALRWSGLSDDEVFTRLHEHAARYDPHVLTALEKVVGVEEVYEPREVPIRDLGSDMLLADDVRTIDGALLVSKGQEVTATLRQRLVNFHRNGRLEGTVRVLVRVKVGDRAAAAAD